MKPMKKRETKTYKSLLFAAFFVWLFSCSTSEKSNTTNKDELNVEKSALSKDPTGHDVINWKNFFKNPPNQKERKDIEYKLSKWKDEESAMSLLTKGRNQVALGYIGDAESTFRQVLRQNPENHEALLELAQIHLRKKQYMTCLDLLADLKERISVMESKDPIFVMKYKYLLALAYLGQKDYERGRAILNEIISTETSFTPGYIALAKSYLTTNKIEIAEFILKRGADRGKEDAGVFNILGVIALRKENQERAMELFNKALQVSPTFIPALVNRARLFISRFELQSAEKDIKQVLTYNPSNVDAMVLLGICSKKQGRISEARSAFTKAIDFDPNSASARFNLAVLLIEHYNRNDEAQRLFEEVINLEDEDLEIKKLSKNYISKLTGN